MHGARGLFASSGIQLLRVVYNLDLPPPQGETRSERGAYPPNCKQSLTLPTAAPFLPRCRHSPRGVAKTMHAARGGFLRAAR